MRFKTMLALALIVALSTTAAMAGAPKADGRMDIETFQRMNRIHGEAYTGRSYFQGFEGTFPPAGWTETITNATYNWNVSNATTPGEVEGSYCAYCPWNSTTYQNESISFNQAVSVAGGNYILSFFMAGAYGTDWDLNVAETVEVNGVTKFDFDSNVTQSFIYEQFFVDLSAYDGQTVTITFRYEGVDGDLHTLDAVMVDDGTGYVPPTPPPPPTNDTCATAIDLQEQGLASFDVDLCAAVGDYSATVTSTCTGWASAGKDVVYKIYLAAGETFMATETGAHDSSLWLATNCPNINGTCVAGADDTYAGDTEVLTYTAPTAGWYYLIVDAYGTVCGVATVTIDAPVGNEDMSWSNVKTMYR